MKKNFEVANKVNSKGITLIALVITIIILLILAGISIATLVGENGILGQATKSKEETEKSQAEEYVKLLIGEYVIEKNTGGKEGTVRSILEFMQEKKTENKIQEVTDNINIDGTIIVEKDGYDVIIDVNTLEIVDVSKTGPRPNVSNQKVVLNSDGTGENIASESINPEVTQKIYISFVASMENGIIESVTCDKGTVTLINGIYVTPVTKNDIYIFTITGKINGQTEIITKKHQIKVNQFEVTKVNEPKISGFNKNSTYYVTWSVDGTNANLYNINDTIKISEKAPSDWYNYVPGVNEWANIKTTGGENDCYWVWIPRYAYKVPSRSVSETIEIKFLDQATNNPTDGSNITISNNTTQGSWNVPPAFWMDNNGDGKRTTNEELTGIWVAKYEASSNTEFSTNLNSFGASNNGDNKIDKVRIVPNVTSWRNISVDNIFYVCKSLGESGNSLEGANVNPHMMKNGEWGVITYLSRSKYGKNAQVWNNPFYNNTTYFSPITGLSGVTKDDKGISQNSAYKYNTKGGTNSSASGTVYGVYDMAGGAWEIVAGYLNEVLESNASLRGFSQSMYEAHPKYKDTYAGSSSEAANYALPVNQLKYGDAVYEISTTGAGTGFDADYSYFLTSGSPIFARGGHVSDRYQCRNICIF